MSPRCTPMPMTSAPELCTDELEIRIGIGDGCKELLEVEIVTGEEQAGLGSLPVQGSCALAKHIGCGEFAVHLLGGADGHLQHRGPKCDMGRVYAPARLRPLGESEPKPSLPRRFPLEPSWRVAAPGYSRLSSTSAWRGRRFLSWMVRTQEFQRRTASSLPSGRTISAFSYHSIASRKAS